MKSPLIIFFFAFYCINGFSQNTRQDTLNEIQELQLLKKQLFEKALLLDMRIIEKQQLLDSLKSKSDTLKMMLKKLKSIASTNNKIIIEQKNRDLKIIDGQIGKEIKTQISEKEILKETSSLIKEIDSRLSQLKNKPT